MKKDEEEELVDKLIHGDETIRDILIERNLRLVVYIARKFENTGFGVEDLISVGTIGLIKLLFLSSYTTPLDNNALNSSSLLNLFLHLQIITSTSCQLLSSPLILTSFDLTPFKFPISPTVL